MVEGGISMDKITKYVEDALRKTEGLDESVLDIYQALVENEARELERIAEQTNTANIDRVASVFLPAIKKLARDSVITKLIGVQPVNDRIAAVNYMDYVYSENYAAGGINKGDSAIDKVATDAGYSNDPGEGQPITKGIDFVIREEGIKARQRKLAGKWTFEAADSTNKLGINLEQEMTKALSAKIVEEINFELLNDLYNKASGGTATWEKPNPSDSPQVKDRKEKELYYAITDVAAMIYDETRRYPNWIVCSPRTAAYLKRSGDFVGVGSPGNVQSIKRLFVQGTLNDEFDVFVVPNLPTNDILVGYKGNSELEAGAIYAPYIPLVIMNSFFNVEDWTWIRSVGSFYGKAFPMTKLYGKVKIA